MIKKWDNFIKESIDLYRLSSDQIIKRINKITETPESEYENGATGMKSDLIHIFSNNLRLRSGWNHIINLLLVYIDNSYNNKSREIKLFLTEYFSLKDDKDNKFQDIRYFVIKLHNKSIEEIKELIFKLLDFYKKVKDEFDTNGTIKASKLSLELKNICINSLDDSILKLYNVYENSLGITIEFGYDSDNIKVDLLSRISDEIVSLCGRIKDETGLENTDINFNNYLLVGFEFPK